MNKDDATWLNICYVAFFALSAYVANKAIFTTGSYYGWVDRYDQWYPIAGQVASVLLGLFSLYILRSTQEKRDYYLATIGEVRKVTWPSLPDTKKMTTVVVIVVAIFSLILTTFDSLWSKALQTILP